MVSRTEVQRLLATVTQLEELSATRSNAHRVIHVDVPNIMDEAAVLKRHFIMYPDDEPAAVVIRSAFFNVEPDDGEDDTRRNIAWRMIAREERRDLGRAEAHKLWLRRLLEKKRNGDKRSSVWEAGSVTVDLCVTEDTAGEILRDAGFDLSSADLSDRFNRGRSDAMRGLHAA